MCTCMYLCMWAYVNMYVFICVCSMCICVNVGRQVGR